MREIAYWTGKSVSTSMPTPNADHCLNERNTSLHRPLPLTRKKLGYFTRLWVTAFFDV